MRTFLALAIALTTSLASAATIEDFTTWSLVEDPADPGMFVRSADSSAVTLEASGPVPSGTDIGFASVDGIQVADSTTGHYFDPASDFAIAIDFEFLSRSTTGAGGIGFGIGEDIDGTDSAGVGFGFVDGVPLAFSTAGRVDDVDQPLGLFATPPANVPSAGGAITNSEGRFFVEHTAATGDVTVGVSTTPGAATPDETVTLAGMAAAWDNEPLLASFFLRSQSVSIIPAIQSGLVRSTFSNFQVLSGTPIRVPEPTAALLATLGALGVLAVPPSSTPRL